MLETEDRVGDTKLSTSAPQRPVGRLTTPSEGVGRKLKAAPAISEGFGRTASVGFAAPILPVPTIDQPHGSSLDGNDLPDRERPKTLAEAINKERVISRAASRSSSAEDLNLASRKVLANTASSGPRSVRVTIASVDSQIKDFSETISDHHVRRLPCGARIVQNIGPCRRLLTEPPEVCAGFQDFKNLGTQKEPHFANVSRQRTAYFGRHVSSFTPLRGFLMPQSCRDRSLQRVLKRIPSHSFSHFVLFLQGTLLIRQGDESTCMYLIISGLFRILVDFTGADWMFGTILHLNVAEWVDKRQEWAISPRQSRSEFSAVRDIHLAQAVFLFTRLKRCRLT